MAIRILTHFFKKIFLDKKKINMENYIRDNNTTLYFYSTFYKTQSKVI